ncbi:MAG: type I-E CRISPR-associated protein Cse1/CasA [Methanomicrobium sp.]|nr:type I-E CRISPR-associated protein Cse1/CasA [Methanomicrobium sp.]
MTNLIKEKWIPVLRKDGSQDTISPIDLLSDSDDNPVVEISSVRPDFDGAIMQFLIGVYQVLLSPEDDKDCRDFFKSKPSVDSLKERIDMIAPAFVLDEGEHRFMQDPSVAESDVWDIKKLLIDIDNTHFIKDGMIQHICPHCAAMALMTLELNSPSGGRGHMTSLRGGGPLTTLVCLPDGEKTLWKNILVNIRSNEQYWSEESTAVDMDEVSRIFPWLMDDMPNSEKVDGEISEIKPGDLHPYHVFFNVPRRVWIDFKDTVSGECDLCGAKSDSLVKNYWSRPNGIKYDSWNHPLTPYYVKTDKNGSIELPVRGKETIGYNNWIGFVNRSPDGSLIPADVVDTFKERFRNISDFKINAFGYATDNAKARVWTQHTLPTFSFDEKYRDIFLLEVTHLIQTADNLVYFTVLNIKQSYTKDRDSSVHKKGKFSDVKVSFWHQTEPLFYDTLPLLMKAIIADSDRGDGEHLAVIECKKNWLKEMRKIVMQIFEERTTIPVNGGADPSTAAKAKRNMLFQFSEKNTKLCKLLGISPPKENAGGKGKK